jgi:hypothetical protein
MKSTKSEISKQVASITGVSEPADTLLEDSAVTGGDSSSKDAGNPEKIRRRNARHRDSRSSLGRAVSGAVPVIES